MTQSPNSIDTVADRVAEVASFDPELGAYQFGDLGQAVKFSDLMCKAGPLIPEFMRDKPALCLGITMRATHWGIDPFGLAEEAFQAKPGGPVGYSAKVFVSALQNQAGIQLRYRYEGEVTYTGKPALSRNGKQVAANEATGNRKCIAYYVIDGEEFIYETPELSRVTIKNSGLWHNDPDQQLAYYAGRGWARRHRPDVMLGALSSDEVREMGGMKDVTPQEGGGSAVGFQALARRRAAAQSKPAPKDEALDPETTIDGTATDVDTAGEDPVERSTEGKGDEQLDAKTVDDLSKWLTEGRDAALSGEPEDDCPYPDDTPQHTAWTNGHREVAAEEEEQSDE